MSEKLEEKSYLIKYDVHEQHSIITRFISQKPISDAIEMIYRKSELGTIDFEVRLKDGYSLKYTPVEKDEQ